MKYTLIMPKVAIFLSIILLSSLFVQNSYSFIGGDLPQPNQQIPNFKLEHTSGILKIEPEIKLEQNTSKRYLVFGNGKLPSSAIGNQIYSISTPSGFFSVNIASENKIAFLKNQGYTVIEDFQVDLHGNNEGEISRIGTIVSSDTVHQKYNYTGTGINIAVVDTGVDFSNPDLQHSLARDENNIPIMLDADGQGIILTNATFIASIDQNNIIRNFSKPIPNGTTSDVYKTKDGVFLNILQGGNGTKIQVYNSFYPAAGPAPVFNGTLDKDMKIGKDNRDFIFSKSGIYHLGVMYQGALQGPLARLQVVPVLVVDSTRAGHYDTIIPDLSTSWHDYTRFDLKKGEKPKYDFDFTDERPITIGNGSEFLVYDSNEDGKNDYSAGTVGARVLDVFSVIENKTVIIDEKLKAVNGTLLPPMDPDGEFFGVMTDFLGHGTGSAASIVAKGEREYDIYNNTKKYTIKGVAPDAKIVPVKALWFGDTVYSWLWTAGFENSDNTWKFSGKPRVDIISNSWGISNFPSLHQAPGLDILSSIVNVLSTPHSLDQNYPGVTIVTSAGNSGHGYGTIGMPNAASYGITVGATTNNVFVGQGGFKDQPRFGNTTEHYNHVVDFSSRGPSIVGDPKPDLMSLGAYSFVPSSVIQTKKDSKAEPFSTFGGTSMAAPLVAGAAALVIEGLQDTSQDYDPFVVKSILMSTASDLKNDPFTQGSGLVNATQALEFIKGEDGMFIVHSEASYENIENIIELPISQINGTSFGVNNFDVPQKNYPQSNWFAGHLLPGEQNTATFTIENPTNKPIDITIHPQTLKLIKKTAYKGETEVHVQDEILNKSKVYAPNYVPLYDIHDIDEHVSYYEEEKIPDNTSLLVLNINFPFSTFMNKTEEIYANDMRISSLYLYDWADKNNDTSITSDELSMVNRAGSWGTVQEMRVTDPKSKFDDVPIVGVYPVPTRYSYWVGDTRQNSTSMDYILSASYYKKDDWNTIWLNDNTVSIPPKSSEQISATVIAPAKAQTGVYQGFLKFEGEHHTTNIPVSYVVKKKIDDKDSLMLISGVNSTDVLYGPGYTKGAFDMTNRYMAGDWRQFYFDISDSSINAAAIDISWEHPDTNLSVFVIDPYGKVVQTNMPSGVFGHFMGWPSVDWLGTTPFSQGGGFFPVKNKDDTSTILYVPINQTGTYGILTHNTLFGGNHTTEPITIAAKFTNIIPDDQSPLIVLDVPQFVNLDDVISPVIKDTNLDYAKYYLDGKEIDIMDSKILDPEFLTEGQHELKIEAVDTAGNAQIQSFVFNVDNSKPDLLIKSPRNGTTVSNNILIEFEANDENLHDSEPTTIILPSGETVTGERSLRYDTSSLLDGNYEIKILAKDKADNFISKTILFTVNHNIIDTEPTPTNSDDESLDFFEWLNKVLGLQ